MNERNKEKIVKFFREIIQQYNFQIMIDINKDLENVFRLIDIQKGNLGGIEQEEFLSLADVIERLEIYHQDYIYSPLEVKQNNNEKIEKDDWDLVVKRYLENDTVAKVLKEINTKEYVDLISKKRKFKIQDIIKILDEDEKFYKSVCEKYVGTMSKEMLLEIDSKILHIYIEDEYIDLKEEAKINSSNYEQYLDGNFEVEEYYFYQELYNSMIKDEIAYDLNDLALFDDRGNWDFYITFEELKRVGYGFMVKEQYPLIEKYAVLEEKIFDFFNYFSLEQLEDFEDSLHKYFVEGSIIYDEIEGLTYNPISHFEAKENYTFNRDILRLACGLISYEDFIQDYIEHTPSYSDLSISKVTEYFKENDIDNLMGYGSDSDEGLYHLTSMYQEIMDKLNIKYENIYTEDGVSDGKYVTVITTKDNTEIKLDTSAWNGIETVTENIATIYEIYDDIKENLEENKVEKDEEISYEYV